MEPVLGLRLPLRLLAVANMVYRGKILADIGTDHAYLPIYLVGHGWIPRAIGVEAREEPWRRARANVEAAGLSHLIDIRLGWGLKPLQPGEVKIITITGLGGRTIQDILSTSPEILENIEYLVLQPQGWEAQLRRWLARSGWRLGQEELVYEKGQYYLIYAWERGANPPYGDWEWEFGPLLLKRRHPLLAGYLRRKLEKLDGIQEGLVKSRRPEALIRLEKLNLERQAIQEVLACLPNAETS
ncbi:MAG: class I SAM-dependent methyltransferase [Thermanaeromonas sp.]|uniref:tRNA (adenine(22)-N(1))-methyltransferase n=1 Tax=Thermanaeromonas sp. TaxID=2003697 RepID=UPI00243D1209|nr:class I SAM-dependent methyltransferase [Thermanaeromonas sp.]MCG0278805.1 class I SAM-dependent methyltransferase [Thermanaeromonas sp.]